MKSSIIRHTMAIVALLMALFHSVAASAADTWSVNPSAYRYDMSLYLDVVFGTGEKLDYTQYDVATFVGDECRGVTEVLPLPTGGNCLYLRARSNSERGESMVFRYRNKATGEVKDVENVSFAFSSNARLGYPSSPYEVKIIIYHDVTLSAGEGGTVSESGGRLAEGTTLSVTATPAEGHHFVQWSDGVTDNPRSVVVGKEDVTLAAEFALTSYHLTYTLDGVSFKESDVLYGTALTLEPNPEKEGYTFSGWQGLPETMPAKDVEVTGTFSINSYQAVFKIGEEIIESKTVVYGEVVVAPEAPAKEGHTFAGWQEVPATMPAHDIVVMGSYTVNKYTLTYKVDGAEYKSVEVDYGTTIAAEAYPTKEGYTFSGWDGLPETMPAKDVEVTGTFSINSYQAVFKIGEEIIDSKTVVYGEQVVAPEAPAKEGHTFAGWQDVPATMPAHDIVILGSYTVNKYTLTYKVDGAEYKSVEVDYGTALTAEPAPEKEGYTFSGWQGLPETMPAKDVEVTGTFSINSYQAVFKIGEEIIDSKTVVYGEEVVAPEAPAKEGHTFAGWQDVPATMPAHDIVVMGSYTVNKYTLTYKVDGAEYKSVEVDYGTTITAEPAPEKEGYTFSGWQGLPETMPAKDVEVTGTFSINSYQAVFKIGEEVIDSKLVVYGEEVVAPEAPAKEGHTFAGWQDVPATMPAHDIVVVGSYTVNKYTLTYKVDGAEYKSVEVDYGTAITAEPVPEKEGYTFSGWQGLPETMPAKDVEVTGTFSINSYQAVFKIGEEVIESKTVVYGEEVVAPEAPAKEGYTFAGWQDVPATMPAHDIVVVGSYTVNKYTLTYKVDGAEYKSVEVDYGTTIVAEPAPEKEGYTFSGWQGLPETMPAQDVEVTGTFSINSYQAVFKIGEEIIESKTVVYGEEVVAPEAPAKEGHTFAGWQDVPATMPAHDIVVMGSYTVNKYTLTYKVDGAEYKSVEVDYGTTLTPEPAPEKEGYTFSGWQGLPETMPAHDVEVTGTFSINSYQAVFKIGEEVIESKTVVYGEEVVAPEAPAKEGHTFAGWQDVPAVMPAHDIVVLGSYTVNKYTLTYKVDGAEYKSVEVDYGTAITAEPNPEKEGYTFSGWQGLPETMPAHDVEVTGTFSINSYQAVFKIGDEVIESKTVVYGEEVVAPEAPAKEGHTFAGWQDVPATMPAHDIVVMGSYTVNKYTLTYKVDGAEYKSVEVDYGTTLTPEPAPEKEGYTFSGWQGLPETMPAHDVEVTGTFSINSYHLTVYLDGELYLDQTLEYGATISVPDPEVAADREFNGWDIEIPATMPAHDVEVHGTTTVVSGLEAIFADSDMRVTICSMNGVVLLRNTTVKEAAPKLKPGLYIVNGRKMVVK